jgi:trehalose utilization protein
MGKIRVTVWNEYRHEKHSDVVKAIYPDGMHNAIAEFLRTADFEVRTATLDDPDCGITAEVLDNTDVLIWWGHMCHHEVPDHVAQMVRDAVLKGMGMIFLHSGHHSKPFRLLMGTTCNLSWREHGDRERLWVVDPSHPIAQGIDRYVNIPHEETYAEPFDIPEPEKLVFIGWYDGGEVFRSGCCYHRGNGNIFYFQPGHESFPTYKIPEIQKIIINAVKWAAPTYRVNELVCPNIPKLED